ncbi:MAG: hypothetical protein NTY33_00320 [Candidatus Moranbacteria bacterium]|nr:hypothetical protein [Candidatus Moranbacteria bacterium]
MTFAKKKNQEQSGEETFPQKKLRWGRYIWLTLFILLVVVIIIIYRFAQKPAEGIVKSGAQDTKAVELGSDVPGTFRGKYISFMYDNKFVVKSDELAQKSGDVILESAYLSETGAMSKKISVTIRSLPSHNLADDPDYLMRTINVKRYRKENFSQGDVQGVAFVPADDNSQFEKIYFVLHNDFVATLSITTPSTLDEKSNKEADAIIKSLTWSK